MARPRSLPPSKRSQPRPAVRPTVVLDGLGLHRLSRRAILELHDRVDVLRHLVGMLDSVAVELLPGDEPEALRRATTMLRACLREVASTAIDASVAVGQLRLIGQLRAIEVEDS